MRFGFRISNKKVDYKHVLNFNFPEVVEAFGAYKAIVSYDLYGTIYQGNGPEENPVYDRLLKDGNVNVDGRNNIYTLYPAQFWDLELCRSALGYGPEEVVKRLAGKVQRVERLFNGVFLVINDDQDLTYEQFSEMNEQVKGVLGII